MNMIYSIFTRTASTSSLVEAEAKISGKQRKKAPQSLFADSKHSFLVLSGENNTLRVTFLGTGLEQLHEQVLTK